MQSRALFLLLLLAACDPGPFPGEHATLPGVIGGRFEVIDGDTLALLGGGDLAGTRLRLQDIRALELDHPLGRAAAAQLAALIAGRPLHCRILGLDRYWRLRARCRAGGLELGKAMVRAGWALPYAHAPKAFAAPLAEAKRARRGIWAIGGAPRPETARSGAKAPERTVLQNAKSLKRLVGAVRFERTTPAV